MPVVEGRPGFSARTRLPLNRVRIIEPDQTFALRSMQCERIFDPVRPGRAHRNATRDKADPMPRFRVDYQQLPVQIEQRIQGRIALHPILLSETDNRLHPHRGRSEAPVLYRQRVPSRVWEGGSLTASLTVHGAWPPAAALAPCSDYTGRFRKSKKPTVTIDDVQAHLAADHRTHTAYVLVPENEYEAMREVIDDERRERAMHALALRNAADRLDEIP
jgi:hypothetical protein